MPVMPIMPADGAKRLCLVGITVTAVMLVMREAALLPREQ